MKGVAGFGIANIDIIFSGVEKPPLLGEEEYGNDCSRQLGGGPVATLIQLARLGIPSSIATYIGTGELSDFLKDELDKSGVDYINMLESDTVDPLTLSCIISCPTDRAIVSYRPRESSFKADSNKVFDFYRKAKIAYISSEDTELCKRLKKEGCMIVLDSAWQSCLSIKQFEEVLPYVDYFIPNEKEAVKMTGTKNAESALKVLSRYIKIPIIKTGKEGCVYLEDHQMKKVLPIDVEHVDSTGAGDAFAAGFIYGLYYNYEIEECIKFANITGGNSVTKVGCLTAYLDEESMKKQYNISYHQ